MGGETTRRKNEELLFYSSFYHQRVVQYIHMWNLGLSDLAQTAKDALARIETTINESVGLDDGDDDDEDDDDKIVEGELARGVVTVRERAPTSEGWSMADGASLDDSGGDSSSGVNVEKESQISDSFVDLKSLAMEGIPKDDEGRLESNTALTDALAQIESLQLLVASLQDELTLAKSEKAMLENQVKELQEENKSSKR